MAVTRDLNIQGLIDQVLGMSKSFTDPNDYTYQTRKKLMDEDEEKKRDFELKKIRTAGDYTLQGERIKGGSAENVAKTYGGAQTETQKIATGGLERIEGMKETGATARQAMAGEDELRKQIEIGKHTDLHSQAIVKAYTGDKDFETMVANGIAPAEAMLHVKRLKSIRGGKNVDLPGEKTAREGMTPKPKSESFIGKMGNFFSSFRPAPSGGNTPISANVGPAVREPSLARSRFGTGTFDITGSSSTPITPAGEQNLQGFTASPGITSWGADTRRGAFKGSSVGPEEASKYQ